MNFRLLNEQLSSIKELVLPELKQMKTDIKDIRQALVALVKSLGRDHKEDDDLLDRERKLWRLRDKENKRREQTYKEMVHLARGKEIFR